MVKKAFNEQNGGALTYDPSKHLNRLAKEIWRKAVPFLEKQKSVERIDSSLIEMYCTQYEIYRNAYEYIKEYGEVQAIYKSIQDAAGEILKEQFIGFKRNPMTQIYSDSVKNLAKIGSELGLSPKSRDELMKLTASDKDKDEDMVSMKEFWTRRSYNKQWSKIGTVRLIINYVWFGPMIHLMKRLSLIVG